ncbi:MAG: GGDEF domain-containing protein [Lachnospiraceae bacterium]|nr:GGDEF domain-containing protein [Lachnospiraceae bacterium]
MDALKELAVSFVEEAYREYLVNKNDEVIMNHLLSYDVSLIGLEAAQWAESFEMVSKYSHVDQFSDDIYCVTTRIGLKNSCDVCESSSEYRIDATTVCKYVDESFKICSLHISGADKFTFGDLPGEVNDLVYKTVLDFAYDVVFECDPRNNIFRYDKEKYKKLFEVDTYFVNADQWFWHMVTECLHPDDTEHLDIFRNNDIGKRIHNKEYVVQSDFRIKNSIKGYIWVRMVVVFIPNQDGSRLQKIFAMFKNIDEEKLKDLDYITKSRTDFLTGLYNREYTKALIDEYFENNHNSNGVFCIVDIDDFKNVNDIFGHITGDELLREIAKRLNQAVEGNDIIGRFGGDEFVVFMKNVENEESARMRLEHILLSMQFEHAEEDHLSSIRFSAGAVLYNADSNRSKIYETADYNLYEAKRAGKNTYRISVVM